MTEIVIASNSEDEAIELCESIAIYLAMIKKQENEL